jgi:hypothetical protein
MTDQKISEEDSNSDRSPQIVYGSTAHVEANKCNLPVLFEVPVVQACWKTNEEVEFYEEEDESSSAIAQEIEKASGMMIYVTKHTLVFLSSVPDPSVRMDAECIVLHAQTDDCVVYLQLQESNVSEDVLEFTITLKNSSDCGRLFQELTYLVSQHPVEDDWDYGNTEENVLGGTNGIHDDASCQDDMVVCIRSNSHEPTEYERNAMLDRLDAILVVPPHLQNTDQTTDGQFDDAEGEGAVNDDDAQII